MKFEVDYIKCYVKWFITKKKKEMVYNKNNKRVNCPK